MDKLSYIQNPYILQDLKIIFFFWGGANAKVSSLIKRKNTHRHKIVGQLRVELEEPCVDDMLQGRPQQPPAVNTAKKVYDYIKPFKKRLKEI